jgi:hypothetical protein
MLCASYHFLNSCFITGVVSRKVDVLNNDRERRDAAKTMLAVAGEKSSQENDISSGIKDKINISMSSPSLAVTFHDQVSVLFI